MAVTLLPAVRKTYAVVNVLQIIIHNQQPVIEFLHIVWEQGCVVVQRCFCNINIYFIFNEEMAIK